jgi:hypothetical protein
MFELVRRLVATLMNRLRPFSRPDDPFSHPDGPDAAVRQPMLRNPGGRSSAVALAEPDVPKPVRAVAPTGTPRHHE